MWKLTEHQLNEIDQLFTDKFSNGKAPSIIYKFRLWNDPPNDNILRELQIRLASPFELQADYSETILPIDESVINEEYKRKVAINEAKLLYPSIPHQAQLLVASQLMASMTIDDKEEREQSYRRSRIRNNEVRGVFCSSYTFENMDQWVYLAGDATGYSVGLDTKKVYLNDKILGSADYVKYYDESNPPKVPPYSFTQQERVNKSMMELYNVPDRFSYEREYRMVRTNHRYDKSGKVAAYTEEERMVQLTPDDYIEILLAIDINEKDKNEILHVRDEKLKLVPIFETTTANGKIIRGKQL